jgi:hypothetical protein
MRRWTVIQSERFARDLAALGPAGWDWADILSGVWWYLERGPLAVGEGTQDIEVRIFMQDTPDGLPDLKIFYLVEQDTVTLLRVKADDPFPF